MIKIILGILGEFLEFTFDAVVPSTLPEEVISKTITNCIPLKLTTAVHKAQFLRFC